MKTSILNLFVLFILAAKSYGQDTLLLKNPSFEGKPNCCVTPSGWDNQGEKNETPPDIQPGVFDCNAKPQSGKTYLGMVTRDNETIERIGQDLDGVLKKDSSYSFSLYLAQSQKYYSFSRMTGETVNYNKPVVLRIWGYNKALLREELLGQSFPIDHKEWRLYDFTFNPRSFDIDGLIFEVDYFKPVPDTDPYNGNLLLDNCSAIIKIKH